MARFAASPKVAWSGGERRPTHRRPYVRRSLAPKGRRFETWAEIEEAVRRATESWNAHKHPFVWGRRRRYRTPRRLGIAAVPDATKI